MALFCSDQDCFTFLLFIDLQHFYEDFVLLDVWQVLACQDAEADLGRRKLCSNRAITMGRTKPLGESGKQTMCCFL